MKTIVKQAAVKKPAAKKRPPRSTAVSSKPVAKDASLSTEKAGTRRNRTAAAAGNPPKTAKTVTVQSRRATQTNAAPDAETKDVPKKKKKAAQTRKPKTDSRKRTQNIPNTKDEVPALQPAELDENDIRRRLRPRKRA